LVDKELRGRDTAERRLRDSILRHSTSIHAVAVSPNGRQVLTGGGDRAQLWDVESGQLLTVLYHRNPVTAVAFGKDGRTLQTASVGDAIRVWAGPEDAEAARSQPHPGKVRAVVVTPDGGLVATAADDKHVRLWKPSPETLVPVGAPMPHPSQIRTVAFSPDGKTLATSTFMRPGVQLWDVATGNKAAFLHHPYRVGQVSFSADGRWVATAGFDGDVWVWDATTGQALLPKPVPDGQLFPAITFSPDGGRLVIAGKDGRVYHRHLPTGAPLGVPLPHADTVRVVVFHPTNANLLLTAGDDGNARLWHAGTGDLVGQLRHGFPILVAAFAADGRTILTGGQDGKTRVWDTATGQEIERPLRHGEPVRAVGASSDGRWAATASEDGTARLWAIRVGRPIGPPIGHAPAALCAAIDPSDRWLVTAGEDQTARLHPAPAPVGGLPERIVRWMESVTGAELDPRGDLRALDPDAWRQRHADFQALGAPPS
jgi:WD40 repeat protein